jgi:DNA repair protein RadC
MHFFHEDPIDYDFGVLRQPAKRRATKPPAGKGLACEYKVVALRETPVNSELMLCDTPEKCAQYLRQVVHTSELYNSEVECFVVMFLNTRRRVKGHTIVSHGTLDTILVHPREVFRPAIIAASASIAISHNHPSGDPTPSDADIKVTRELIRAGQLLKIELVDHVIMGSPCLSREKDYVSLREQGYFFN